MKRRTFFKNTIAASTPLLFLPSAVCAVGMNTVFSVHDKINNLATSLLEKWCVGLYANQTISPGDKGTDGGIYSPGDEAYLGRSADALYPFLWMAKQTNDKKYVEAAKMVYTWEQNNCWSEEHGCWYNNPNQPESWKGITVFAAMTKMEAIEHYSDLLGEETVREWENRLHRAAEYIYLNFSIDFGNINYPAVVTLVLHKLGVLFNEEKYIEKANVIAKGLLDYFTPDGLFFGEGGRTRNEAGQYPIDLGYNVEESLPAMALYCRLSGNKELYAKVLNSMKAHLEFMLPNGGWDNSWGTRSFKWTLWGSRTSDGCHPGYYALADEEPVFAEAVYQNLKCLEASTANNLLHSGPHEFIEGILPSTHHSFDHAKALVSLLHLEAPEIPSPENILPREKEYGIKKFDSINTILFSKGPWRGTVTAYNVNYKNETNGHASGGALSLLYHMQTGMVSAASMTEYQLWERFNMLDDKKVENFMNLTPRLELTMEDKRVYRNISDFDAKISYTETGDEIVINTQSRLVNGEQIAPEEGTLDVYIDYRVKDDLLSIEIAVGKTVTNGKLRFIFPVVCSGHDKITLNDNSFKLKNNKGSLTIQSNYNLGSSIYESQRVYNFVPGLQAFPIEIDCSQIHEKKLVLNFSV
jgi:hypothetical protein